MQAANGTLNSYTNSTWTDLKTGAAGGTVVKALVVSTGANAALVKVRLANSGGTSLAVLVAGTSLPVTSSYTLDLPALTLTSGQKLQVWADVSGVEFAAFGAE